MEEKESKQSKLEKKISDVSSLQAVGLLKTIPKTNISAVTQNILEHLRKADHDGAKRELRRHYKTDEEIYAFLSGEGGGLILTESLTIESSQLLKDFVAIAPINALKETLKKGNFRIFTSFCETQISLENILSYKNPEKDRLEKFRILLTIDGNGVKNFIQTDPYIKVRLEKGKKTKADFETALAEYQQEVSNHSGLNLV